MSKSPKTGKKHRKSNLAKLEAKLKILYDSWGGKTFCPAVGTHVYFTNVGWNHIRRVESPKDKVESQKSGLLGRFLTGWKRRTDK